MTEQAADSAVYSAVGSDIAAVADTAAATRAALRREKIAARHAMTAVEHAQASQAIIGHLETLLQARVPATVGFCWPIRREVDCRPLVERLLAAGWHAAMPTVVAPASPMQCRVWTPGAPMTVDPFGIPVPAGTATCVPDVLLLPLVAFDAAGYRLGYGGGYFDRTLAILRPLPLTIGIGFECGIVASITPGPHDVPLDCVVTETGIRAFKSAVKTTPTKSLDFPQDQVEDDVRKLPTG